MSWRRCVGLWCAWLLLVHASVAQAPSAGVRWRAGSKTAESITGDIVLAGDSVTMLGKRYPLTFVREFAPGAWGELLGFPMEIGRAHV